MPSIVVPFHLGKTRLAPLDPAARREAALSMLADVLSACTLTGRTLLVTDDVGARELAARAGAEVVDDPGRGQGAAVAAGLERLEDGPVLVVNADLPLVTADDLAALLEALPTGGLAVAAAADGTTNALALSSPSLFAPLYGPGSSEEFRSHASQLGVPSAVVTIPALVEDVDTAADLDRVVSPTEASQ